MANVNRAQAVLAQQAVEDQSGAKENGLRDMRSVRREREKMKAEVEKKQQKMQELQEELAEIQEDMDSFWGKVGSFFGSDGGMADTTEALGKTGADIEKLNNELLVMQEESKDIMADLQEKQDGVAENYQAIEEMLNELGSNQKKTLA